MKSPKSEGMKSPPVTPPKTASVARGRLMTFAILSASSPEILMVFCARVAICSSVKRWRYSTMRPTYSTGMPAPCKVLPRAFVMIGALGSGIASETACRSGPAFAFRAFKRVSARANLDSSVASILVWTGVSLSSFFSPSMTSLLPRAVACKAAIWAASAPTTFWAAGTERPTSFSNFAVAAVKLFSATGNKLRACVFKSVQYPGPVIPAASARLICSLK